ncbi:MAG: hypothetical protein DMG22_13115 [Acidobacteria bacterium]|nr:MAG: hypothetical protein DMG22_13115 [Acidobacteriota bacterium]
MHPGIEEGIRPFNAQEFYEEHEALEAVWLKAEALNDFGAHGPPLRRVRTWHLFQ